MSCFGHSLLANPRLILSFLAHSFLLDTSSIGHFYYKECIRAGKAADQVKSICSGITPVTVPQPPPQPKRPAFDATSAVAAAKAAAAVAMQHIQAQKQSGEAASDGAGTHRRKRRRWVRH